MKEEGEEREGIPSRGRRVSTAQVYTKHSGTWSVLQDT